MNILRLKRVIIVVKIFSSFDNFSICGALLYMISVFFRIEIIWCSMVCSIEKKGEMTIGEAKEISGDQIMRKP